MKHSYCIKKCSHRTASSTFYPPTAFYFHTQHKYEYSREEILKNTSCYTKVNTFYMKHQLLTLCKPFLFEGKLSSV